MRKISRIIISAVSCILCLLVFNSIKADVKTTKTTIRPKLMYNLRGIYPRVVQRAAIYSNHIYVIQMYGKDAFIQYSAIPKKKKTINFNKRNKIRLKGFGHTQTLVYSGKGNWFVGCTPVAEKTKRRTWLWDTEIARISFPKRGSATYANKRRLPHLVNLKYATDMPQQEFPGVRRAEAAVSPNHKYLLIAVLDKKNNGHFAIYNLSEANRKLDAVKHKRNKSVSLRALHQISAFHINKLMGNNPATSLRSVQGFDIANDRTIYISNEEPTYKKGHSVMPREIVKINWGDTNPSNWHHYLLNDPSWRGKATELEGLELAGNKIHQVVSFHYVRNPKTHRSETINSIYQIAGIGK